MKFFENLSKKLHEKTDSEEIRFHDYREPAEIAEPAEPVTEEPAPAEKDRTVTEGEAPISLKVVKPESFQDVGTIADYLIDGCTVVLNVEQLEDRITARMLDFLGGVTYSTKGEIRRAGPTTFIIAPRNVDFK